MSKQVRVTPVQVYAAQLIVERDSAEGRVTPEVIQKIAEAEGVPRPNEEIVHSDVQGAAGPQGAEQPREADRLEDRPKIRRRAETEETSYGISATPSTTRSRRIDAATDALVGEWLSLPDAANQLGIPAGRLRQLLRDRKLLAATRPEGTISVPAAFLDGHQIVKGLAGTLILLFDCGFDDLEALRWLFTPDDSLPGTPIDAISKHRGTEVNRRAVELSF